MLKKLQRSSYLNTSGIKLSYLTLKIDDATVTKEFIGHKTAKQNKRSFFIVALCSTLLNLIVSIINFFKTPNYSYLGIT